MIEHECYHSKHYGVDSEWCREWCMNYGTGKCRYDHKTGKMLVKDEVKND